MFVTFGELFTEGKQEAEETGSTSTATENVVEKGEVEATKEGEKEKDNKNDKNEKETDCDKEKDITNEQEVVFIQDLGFTVKIVSPGSEPFDIQVSSMELVQVNSLYCNIKSHAVNIKPRIFWLLFDCILTCTLNSLFPSSILRHSYCVILYFIITKIYSEMYNME